MSKHIENNCSNCDSCSAPLCPLDAGIEKRVWYADEPICKSRQYGQHRWIQKQRSIVKRQTNSFLDRPVTYEELFAASRPRQLTDEQRLILAERCRNMSSSMTQQSESIGGHA